MPPILGNIIVILVLVCVVALVVRSLWKSRKNGCRCGGDCSCCGGCAGRKKTADP